MVLQGQMAQHEIEKFADQWYYLPDPRKLRDPLYFDRRAARSPTQRAPPLRGPGEDSLPEPRLFLLSSDSKERTNIARTERLKRRGKGPPTKGAGKRVRLPTSPLSVGGTGLSF